MRLERKNNQIDLEAPIYMADWQLERFKNFMKKTFDESVEYVNIEEPEPEWGEGGHRTPMKFSPEEMLIMLQPGSMGHKIKKLKELYPDRENWSVELKIGIAFPLFNKFLKDRGEKSVTKENVREFLTEMGWL
jgi:hypothetical protein